MKTTLPERSLFIKEHLEEITREILDAAKGKIAMIILFGSYGRGDWKRDEYSYKREYDVYQSDLDIMVIVSGPHGERAKMSKIERDIDQRLEKKGLLGVELKEIPVTIMLDHISVVNKNLERGQYFYSDLKKEGILLYDSGKFKLAEPRELAWEEVKEIADGYYKRWFKRGSGFVKAALYMLQQEYLNHSAFLLHQATESFYNAILLTFSGYKKKLHDIKKLRSMASNYDEELWSIFPSASKEQKECFELLERAYIEARYSDDYKISKEQLLYLIGEVEKLQRVTERICTQYVSR